MADACPPQRLPTGRQEAKEGQSVDPLAAKYPGWSPYNYVRGNPLRLIDPDGMQDWDPDSDVKKKQKAEEEKQKAERLKAEQAAQLERLVKARDKAEITVSKAVKTIGEAFTSPLKTLEKLVSFAKGLIPGAKDGNVGKTANSINKANDAIAEAPELIKGIVDANQGKIGSLQQGITGLANSDVAAIGDIAQYVKFNGVAASDQMLKTCDSAWVEDGWGTVKVMYYNDKE